MVRAVIDSSVWVAGLLSDRGSSHEVLLRGLKGEFDLISSPDIVSEVVRAVEKLDILHKVRQPGDEGLLIELLLSKSREVSLDIKAVRDPHDDIILACALEHGADYLVSLDKDFTDMGSYEALKIMRPGEFLKILKEEHL
ncbi:MAG: putative toxin-antitoxin system toxin component, PIN family [Deltaproteobacteria bacterium]|nr:putative toxin-antitoxin system toxin component, PIN family [Deltaproteobacteria bacterium]